MKKLMRRNMKMLVILMVVALMATLIGIGAGVAGAAPVPVTLYYEDITIDGTTHWLPGSWDLTAGPVTVSYELDLRDAPNNACNDWGGCPGVNHWSSANVGLVWSGSPWAGAWMSGFLSDWDNLSTMFPTFPDNDNSQDLDDKFNMARSPNPGTYDERHYDVDCSTNNVVTEVGVPTAWSNYGIWYDRDGVDQWQATMWGMVDGGTFNTGGVYQVQIEYEKSSNYPSSKGTACATFFPNLLNPLNYNDPNDDIYGIPTGFGAQVGGGYQYFPYGISFDTDETKMTDMRVFVSGGVYPGGTIVVRDLTVTGYLNPDATKEMCKKGGWKLFTAPSFKNQGQCVSYFAKMK